MHTWFHAQKICDGIYSRGSPKEAPNAMLELRCYKRETSPHFSFTVASNCSNKPPWDYFFSRKPSLFYNVYFPGGFQGQGLHEKLSLVHTVYLGKVYLTRTNTSHKFTYWRDFFFLESSN